MRHSGTPRSELPAVKGGFAEGLRWTKDEEKFTFPITFFPIKILLWLSGHTKLWPWVLESISQFIANSVILFLKREKWWDWY